MGNLTCESWPDNQHVKYLLRAALLVPGSLVALLEGEMWEAVCVAVWVNVILWPTEIAPETAIHAAELIFVERLNQACIVQILVT